MHLFLEVRDDVDGDSVEPMRSVVENEAEVGSDTFALRVAVAADDDASPLRLSVNVLVPIESALYWIDGNLADRRYVPTLPSRSLLSGSVVPVRWAVARAKLPPGDVRVFDLAVLIPEDAAAVVVRANVGWQQVDDPDVRGEEFVEAVVRQS